MKDFSDPGKALAYIADCQLATVEWMATIKRKSQSDYRRQIDIAETCVAAAVLFSAPADIDNTRMLDVSIAGSVEAYAKALEERP